MTDDEYDRLAFAIVSPEGAATEPYPFVHVTEDGAAHELDKVDREYLEERFHPGDSGRPFVKNSYDDKNGWGNLRGFCSRDHIPDEVAIDPVPFPKDRETPFIDRLREATESAGLEFVENADGTYQSRRPASLDDEPTGDKKPWWKFWG